MGDRWEQYAEPAPDKWAKYAEPAQTLAQRIRAKYPNAYNDLDDATLESRILAKHPEYSDLPRTQPGKEALDLKLPSGELVTAIVPAGYSDDQVRTLMKLKRPDLYPGQLPAPMPKPPNPIIDQEPESTGQQIRNVVGGMAKGVYDVSAPGIAASIAQKYRPDLTPKLPSWLQPPPLSEVPGNVVVQGGLMLLGTEEARPALAAGVDAARIVNPAPVEGAGPSLLSRLPRMALRHTPVVGKYVRLYDATKSAADMLQKFQHPSEAAPPPVPPGFTLERTGNVTPQGPPELWGRPAPRAVPAPSLAPSHEVPQAMPLAASHEPAAYPPEVPTRRVEPTRMSYQQLQEDQGLAQQIREAAESEDRVRLMDNIRQWVGRNNPGVDKGVMAQEFAAQPVSIKEAVDHLENIRKSDVQADSLLKQLERALQQGEAEPDFLGKVSEAQEAILKYYGRRLRSGAAKR